MFRTFTSVIRPLDIAGRVVVNFFLTIITFGVYYFWGKSALRRYVWGGILVDEEPLEYRGTGSELFMGALLSAVSLAPLAGILVVLWLAFVPAGASEREVSQAAGLFIGAPLLGFVFPFMRFRAAQYLASRTELRGVRFGVSGSALSFATKYAMRALVGLLTLGLLFPWAGVAAFRNLATHTWYGDVCGRSTARTQDVLLMWAACLLFAVPTLGLSILYFDAYRKVYLVSSLSFQGVSAQCSATALEVLGVTVVNYLLMVCSLGLAYPWVVARRTRFWSNKVLLAEQLDFKSVKQSAIVIPFLGRGVFAGDLAV